MKNWSFPHSGETFRETREKTEFSVDPRSPKDPTTVCLTRRSQQLVQEKVQSLTDPGPQQKGGFWKPSNFGGSNEGSKCLLGGGGGAPPRMR